MRTLFCRDTEGIVWKNFKKIGVHNNSLKIMREKPQGLNKANKKDLVRLKVLEVNQKQKDDRKIFYKQN